MAVNMKTGGKVQAIDELGRYADGKIVKLTEEKVEIQFAKFGPEHNQTFRLPLGRYSVRKPEATLAQQMRGGWTVFIDIYCYICFDLQLYSCVYSCLFQPFVFWSRDRKSHDPSMMFPCHVDDKQQKIFTTNYAFRGSVLILGHHHTNAISNDMVTAQYWLVCQAKFDNKLLCMIVMMTAYSI